MSRIAAACPAPRPRWHKVFLAMLPAIVAHARYAFRDVHGQDRQDLIQETIANSFVAFLALVRRGKMAIAYPSVLARYAVAQIHEGRRVGNRLDCHEVLSPYAQRLKNFKVQRLDRRDKDDENAWCEVLVEDKRCGPAQIACTKIDFEEWLKSLPVRYRRLAQFLSLGNRTQDAARKLQVAPARSANCAASWPRAGGSSWATSRGRPPCPRRLAAPHPAGSGSGRAAAGDENPAVSMPAGKIPPRQAACARMSAVPSRFPVAVLSPAGQ